MTTENSGEEVGGARPLESRPGVFLIGAPNVGKRTLLSRLLSVDIPENSDLSSGVLCHGWRIDTKYYSADLSVWTANLDEGFSFATMPFSMQLSALVMVFDMSDEVSFTALQKWVPSINIQKFDILLCIGNKADLVHGHYAHGEYRRWLQKQGESISEPHPEFFNYGIDEAEACSLLGEEEPSLKIRQSSLEWCNQHYIEFIEACASNAEFDKCLSVYGDIQGVERLYGALAAHMWPGMVLKSGNKLSRPPMFQKEEMTDDESDYEIEYELLSGPDESFGDYESGPSASCSEFSARTSELGAIINEVQIRSTEKISCEILDDDREKIELSDIKEAASVSTASENFSPAPSVEGNPLSLNETNGAPELKDVEDKSANQKPMGLPTEVLVGDEDTVANSPSLEDNDHLSLDEVEMLMGEISNMRDSLRLMPDYQRREMAANLTLKMAAMFGDSSDDDGF